MARPDAARFYEAWLTGGMLDRLAKVVADHPAAAHLDDEDYGAQVLRQLLTPQETRLLRRTAELTHGARALDDLAPATEALAGLVASAGLPRTAQALAAAATATIPPKPAQHLPIVLAQEIIAPWFRPYFFAEPPKIVPPELMERIPHLSGKEAADNIPSWAKGAVRRVGETPQDFAKRIIEEQSSKPFDPDKTGPTSDFNKIKKFGERAFRSPKNKTEDNPKPDKESEA